MKVTSFINSRTLLRLSILLIMEVTEVFPDSHSLRYYYTVVSDTGWGLPEFSIVGYVDDQQIENYSSDSRVARPVAPWMKKEGAEYWDTSTDMGKDSEFVFRLNLRTAMSRYNQTGGFHSIQMMYGCELGQDGSVWVYSQYGYDGKDLIYLDTKSWNYIASVPEALISAQRSNDPEVHQGETDKHYLETVCIESLQEYVSYGRDALEKRVPPEVKVSGHQSDGVTRLRCWVHGFHPRAVDVKWMRDGVDEVPIDEATQILPNPDGTYQTRVSVEVTAGEEQRYSCHVDHSSLEETLIVTWGERSLHWGYSREPKSGFPIGVILGVVGGLFLLAAVIAAVFIYRSKNKGKSSETTSSESSDHLKAFI